MAILISTFSSGYNGKTVDFEAYSPCHRTTIAHFLNHGKWDDRALESILKSAVLQIIYGEAHRSGKPVFCIVDGTISSKTKPSSQALHPIEDAYFHQSHLKRKQDYGHQAVAVMLSCNGIRQNISSFALHLRKTDTAVRLVTVGSRKYSVYRYEGSLNGLENAVVLISYPRESFHNPKTLRAFISTDVSLSTCEILDAYVERWPVEIFFRQSKGKLAFNRYQIRSAQGIRRYWLLIYSI